MSDPLSVLRRTAGGKFSQAGGTLPSGQAIKPDPKSHRAAANPCGNRRGQSRQKRAASHGARGIFKNSLIQRRRTPGKRKTAQSYLWSCKLPRRDSVCFNHFSDDRGNSRCIRRSSNNDRGGGSGRRRTGCWCGIPDRWARHWPELGREQILRRRQAERQGR